MIIWISNISLIQSNYNAYHILITILLFLFVVNQTLLYFEYKQYNQTDEFSQISNIRPYLKIIYELFLYNTIVLILSGHDYIYRLFPVHVYITNFIGCLILIFIPIPSGVINIDDGAVAFCNQLETIKFEENSHLIRIGFETFISSVIKSLLIPSSVVRIDNCDF